MVKHHWIQTKDVILAKYPRIERIAICLLKIHKEPTDIFITMSEPCEHDVDIEAHTALDSRYEIGIPVRRSLGVDEVDEEVMGVHDHYVGKS